MKLATLCYVKHEGRTLMMHRVKKADDIHQGKWNGLGGKLEPGESPEECVVREVREESGLEVRAPCYHGLLVFTNFKGDDWYVWVFTATQFEGRLIDSPEGNLKWILDPELTSLPLWDSDHLFFPWLKKPGVFSAKFDYDGEKMLGHSVSFYL